MVGDSQSDDGYAEPMSELPTDLGDATVPPDETQYRETAPPLSLAETRVDLEDNADHMGADSLVEGFSIIREIGKGGMGRVYLARREKTRDLVALKLVSGNRLNKKLIARFEEETRVLALMNHRNIAHLYQAGVTSDGTPYFAMEFLEGRSLSRFVRENKLSLDQKLRLFLQVCDGVQHAHQKTVLHRDLKPSNIMVVMEDGEPVAKLIDFGLARVLDPTYHRIDVLETRMDAVQGTPAYMSPEQLGRNRSILDTRTDVYALGVILFELITGEHPLDLKKLQEMSVDEMLSEFRLTETQPPSVRLEQKNGDGPGRQLARRIEGDLDWVVMKAMAKDPDQRYVSVSALKSDLSAFLNHFPVSARRPGIYYRLKKTVRRHRLPAAMLATVAVTLLVSMFVVVSSWHSETRARQRAESALDFLEEALSTPDVNHKGFEATILDAVDYAENRLDERPEIEGRVRYMLGKTYLSLQKREKAIGHLEIAARLYEDRYGRNYRETLKVRAFLGKALLEHDRNEEALQILSDVLQVQQRYQMEDGETAAMFLDWGIAYTDNFEHEKAEVLFQDTLRSLEDRFADHHPLVLRTRECLAYLRSKQKKFHEAEQLLRQTLPHRRRLGSENRESLQKTLNNLGLYLKEQGAFAEAIPFLEEAFESRMSSMGVTSRTMGTLFNLASCYAALGRYPEGHRMNSEVMDFYLKKGNTRRVLRCLVLEAKLLLPDEPEIAYERLADVYEPNVRERVRVEVLLMKSKTSMILGNLDEAELSLLIAQAVLRDAEVYEPEIWSKILQHQSEIQISRGQLEEGLFTACRALETAMKYGTDTWTTKRAVVNYAQRLAENGRVAEGEKQLVLQVERLKGIKDSRAERSQSELDIYRAAWK
ncbi:MAG: serine/threonine-protein kinase [Acidobacteriota bacterium]|nr:serine/threonine-protein kinase [Acidobacteriota bacterium]